MTDFVEVWFIIRNTGSKHLPVQDPETVTSVALICCVARVRDINWMSPSLNGYSDGPGDPVHLRHL